MRKRWSDLLGLSLGLLLLLACAHVRSSGLTEQQPFVYAVSQDSAEAPSIEWWESEPNATTVWVLCWDGIYTGQTREVWSWVHWVNDTDGVDSVIFRYRWDNESDWNNRTTVRVAGDETHGQYEGNFTYSVWWDRGRNCVRSEGYWFWFKVFANDTLGNWAETIPVGYMGGYLIVEPPLVHWLRVFAPFIVTGVGVLVAVKLIVAVSVRRKQPLLPKQQSAFSQYDRLNHCQCTQHKLLGGSCLKAAKPEDFLVLS